MVTQSFCVILHKRSSMERISLLYKSRMTFLLVSLLILLSPVVAWADNPKSNTILVISSYNPEAQNLSDNISEFVDEFEQMGGDASIVVESLNCKNLSEAFAWNERLQRILDKYTNEYDSLFIVLLGQEAWATYLSLESPEAKKIPIACGMASSNVVTIPMARVDLSTWEPISKNIQTDFSDFNIVGGFLYEYDIDKNIELIEKFFPQTKRVSFLTDNTYGGINLQTLAKKRMKEFPHLECEWLDGRVNSVLDVNEKIAYMGDSTCVIVGTWRIDSTEKYVVGRTNYMLYDLNPTLPVFSASSVGLGTWVLGGYSPKYQMIGRPLANVVYSYLYANPSIRMGLELIPNHYVFDAKRLEDFGIRRELLPADTELLNVTPRLIEQYKFYVLGILAVFIILLISFFTVLYYVIRINRLKHNLEKSSIELLCAKEEAEESNRLKTAFLANMSHEIRTPLNAIVGFSNVLIGKEATDEEREQYCEIIQKNSDLLLHLINDILDISRLESGRIKLLSEKCDLIELCETAVATVEYTRRTDACFKLELPQGTVEFMTDSQRFQQVLINLLTNAAKFTSSGSITINVSVEESENRILVKVIDTGCGIPVDKSERIFERFEKLDEHAQGTGLGLPICRVIIEQLGGKIWLDKEYVGGACFVFTHPLHQFSRHIQ